MEYQLAKEWFMNKKMIRRLLFLLSFALASLAWLSWSTGLLAYTETLYSKIKIFTSLLETIQRAYVEEKSADELMDDAIKGVLSKLDPHTVYLPADDFKSWNQSFEGYAGIGIGFEIIREKITVISIIESGPAAKVGLRTGDKIVAINGEAVLGIKREEVASKLMGAPGTTVNLLVERGPDQRLRFQITRERILLDSISQALMIKPGVGYIKIERFTGASASELEHALARLEANGMKNLILDLRGNSGGYLNAAIEVADKFIPGGHKILTTKGRLASSFQEYYSTWEATHELYPMAVLIDHGSASAAEIVAGAIQDLDRGLIVGKTSFGKGLVQSQYRFHDGSALLITTAKYYTPSGRAIQRDYYEKTKDEYYRDAYNDARKSDPNKNGQSSHKTISGRPVYGGGGITPDVWVESDNNILSENLRQVFYSDKRHFYIFAEDIIKKNPAIKNNVNDFVNNFSVTEKMYQDFVASVRRNEPSFSEMDFAADKTDIKFLIKRELAYLIGGAEARFRVNMARDKQLNEAILHLPSAAKLLTLSHLAK
jgi:carboxyl-terminal processing protease